MKPPPALHLESGIKVRQLEGEDGPALQRLLEQCNDYSETAFGIPTGAADAQSQFLEGLDLVPEEQKFLMGGFFEDQMILGADSLFGYPDPKTLVLGLFVIDPRFRSKGIGGRFVSAWAAWAHAAGADSMRVDCHVAENEAALPFWRRLGFSETRRWTVQPTSAATRTRVRLVTSLPLTIEGSDR